MTDIVKDASTAEDFAKRMARVEGTNSAAALSLREIEFHRSQGRVSWLEMRGTEFLVHSQTKTKQ